MCSTTAPRPCRTPPSSAIGHSCKRTFPPCDATPHRLRHTYLLLLRRAGVDAATQQYLMGHADYDTTANIYTHIDETDVTTATAQLLTTLPPR